MERANEGCKMKKDEKTVEKPETRGDLLDMFDDGTEKRGEMSFMDLPDDILINIFEFLDFPSRFKLRLNKRLNQLQSRVKNNCGYLEISIFSSRGELALNARSFCQYHDFDQLELGLRRLAINTSIDTIKIDVHGNLNERNAGLIDAISNIRADRLTLFNYTQDGLPQLTLSTLLNFAKNVRAVEIKMGRTSLSAQDLCTFRKSMIDSDCKLELELFSMTMSHETTKSFANVCFGVTIEDVTEPVRGRIYHAADESVKLYSREPGSYSSRWDHFEADLVTSFSCGQFIIEKGRIFKGNDKYKIIMNHFYVDQ